MGVILARMISKEMIYNRINGSNVLTMVFDTGCILPCPSNEISAKFPAPCFV